MTTTPSGLQFDDVVPGTGAALVGGQSVTVHYTGWLQDASAPEGRGKKFDSSVDRGEPFDLISARAWSSAAGTKACKACRGAAPGC